MQWSTKNTKTRLGIFEEVVKVMGSYPDHLRRWMGRRRPQLFQKEE
jgi:hypothetical protein